MLQLFIDLYLLKLSFPTIVKSTSMLSWQNICRQLNIDIYFNTNGVIVRIFDLWITVFVPYQTHELAQMFSSIPNTSYLPLNSVFCYCILDTCKFHIINQSGGSWFLGDNFEWTKSKISFPSEFSKQSRSISFSQHS